MTVIQMNARRIADAALSAATASPDPTPLYRDPPPGDPFPIESLPAVLRAGVGGVVGHVQCPTGLAAQSVLAAASLVAQAHVNVRTLSGSAAPASLYLVTVAASGERKSSADNMAMRPAADHESRLRTEYVAVAEEYQVLADAWEAAHARAKKTKGGKDAIAEALRAVGPRPSAPPKPVLLCGEPTWEGLWLLLCEGPGFAGVMSAEGGSFFGGHAMGRDTKLKTAAALSEAWDGAPIRRVRRGDGVSVLTGRRVALHLLAQVETSRAFLADRVLLDQGLLSRVLVAAPASTMGERLYREPSAEDRTAFACYRDHMGDLFAMTPARALDDPRALAPRVLELGPGAKDALIAFADEVEEDLRPDGGLRAVSGHAAKLAEQAARIAAVFTWTERPSAETIGADTMEAAIDLANWYGAEALRLYGSAAVSPSLAAAEALRLWLLEKWCKPEVRTRDVVRCGPNALRTTEAAKAALAALVEHGWVTPSPDAKGDAWRVVTIEEAARWAP